MKDLVKVTVVSLGFVLGMASCSDDQEVVKRPTQEPVKKTVTEAKEELPLPEDLLPVEQGEKENESSETESKKETGKVDNSNTELSPLLEPAADFAEYETRSRANTLINTPSMGIIRKDYTPKKSMDFVKLVRSE